MQNSNGTPSAVREFSVGSIISRTFSTLFQNPTVYFGLPLAAMLPAVIVLLFLPDVAAMESGSAGISIQTWLVILTGVGILSIILALAIQGAIAYAVFQSFRGETASFGDALSCGMSRILTLILAAILTGLAIGLATLLLVVPGLIVASMLAVTIPSCVVEKKGVWASMERSASLTRGCRLKVFALVVIVFLVQKLFENLPGIFITDPMQYKAVLVVAALISFVPIAFSSVMYAIVYYDLRMIKEGLSLDSLVRVFD